MPGGKLLIIPHNFIVSDYVFSSVRRITQNVLDALDETVYAGG